MKGLACDFKTIETATLDAPLQSLLHESNVSNKPFRPLGGAAKPNDNYVQAMDKTVLIKMNWHLRRQLNNLGWPGIVGLGLFAFCIMFYFSAVRPLQDQLDETRQQAQALGKHVQSTQPGAGMNADPAEKLSGFYKFFPKSSSMPDWLAKIYGAAEQQNLVLQQGEYRLVHDNNGRLVRYEIFFPVKGDYVQIRKFLTRIMSEIPYLSLDGISFQRQKIGDAFVESQIKLTLFLGEGT